MMAFEVLAGKQERRVRALGEKIGVDRGIVLR
jgi:hypothetical protein